MKDPEKICDSCYCRKRVLVPLPHCLESSASIFPYVIEYVRARIMRHIYNFTFAFECFLFLSPFFSLFCISCLSLRRFLLFSTTILVFFFSKKKNNAVWRYNLLQISGMSVFRNIEPTGQGKQ